MPSPRECQPATVRPSSSARYWGSCAQASAANPIPVATSFLINEPPETAYLTWTPRCAPLGRVFARERAWGHGVEGLGRIHR